MTEIELCEQYIYGIRHYNKLIYYWFEDFNKLGRVCLQQCKKYPIINMTCYSPTKYDFISDKGKNIHFIYNTTNDRYIYDYIIGKSTGMGEKIDISANKIYGLKGEQNNQGDICLVYIKRKPETGGKVIVCEKTYTNGEWGEETEWGGDFFDNGYFQSTEQYYIKSDLNVQDYSWKSKIKNANNVNWSSLTSINRNSNYCLPVTPDIANLKIRFRPLSYGTTGSSEPAWNIHKKIISWSVSKLDGNINDPLSWTSITRDNNILWQKFNKEIKTWQTNTIYVIGDIVKTSENKLFLVDDISCRVDEYKEEFNEGINKITEYNDNLFLCMEYKAWHSLTNYEVGNIVYFSGYSGIWECTKAGKSGDETPQIGEGIIDNEVWWKHRDFGIYAAPDKYRTYPVYFKHPSENYVFKCIGMRTGDTEPSQSSSSYPTINNPINYFLITNKPDKLLCIHSVGSEFKKDTSKLSAYITSNFSISDGDFHINIHGQDKNFGSITANEPKSLSFDLDTSIIYYMGFFDSSNYIVYACQELTFLESSFPANGEITLNFLISKLDYIYPNGEDKLITAINESNKCLYYDSMEYEEDIYTEEDLTNFIFSNGGKYKKDNINSMIDFKGKDKFYILYVNTDYKYNLAKFDSNFSFDYDFSLPETENDRDLEYTNLQLGNYIYILDFKHIKDWHYTTYYLGDTRVNRRNLTDGSLLDIETIYSRDSLPARYGFYLIVDPKRYYVVYNDGQNRQCVECELLKPNFFPFFMRYAYLNTLNTGGNKR